MDNWKSEDKSKNTVMHALPRSGQPCRKVIQYKVKNGLNSPSLKLNNWRLCACVQTSWQLTEIVGYCSP